MYKVRKCYFGSLENVIADINESGEYIISTVVIDRTVMIITQEPEQLHEWTLDNAVDA